jgi:hypothetical protein
MCKQCNPSRRVRQRRAGAAYGYPLPHLVYFSSMSKELTTSLPPPRSRCCPVYVSFQSPQFIEPSRRINAVSSGMPCSALGSYITTDEMCVRRVLYEFLCYWSPELKHTDVAAHRRQACRRRARCSSAAGTAADMCRYQCCVECDVSAMCEQCSIHNECLESARRRTTWVFP